jgi:hypothetical protein
VGYIRGEDGYNRPPDELTDYHLLKLFPSRTLEELDEIDLARLNRALAAGQVERIEERRTAAFEGKKRLTPEDAEAIRLHDRLMGEAQRAD